MIRIALVTGLLVLGACTGDVEDPAPPHVLLVTLDAVRSDRLEPYGYAYIDTPSLNGLMSGGVTFSRAYATAPLTLPSHASILTGLAPPSHGVRDDGGFSLRPEVQTLAERFRDAGYATAAFTGSFLTHPIWGLDQGFDSYQAVSASQVRVPCDEVVDAALAALPAADRPVFLWVHLFDAHGPWQIEVGDPVLDGLPYDAALAKLDVQLGRLLTGWDAAYPQSLVAVTADHGEALGRGNELGHGFLLNDQTLRVPLFLRGLHLPAGHRIVDPVSHLDLAPTMLRLAGLTYADLPGRDLLATGSTRPYSETLRGQHALGFTPLFSFTESQGRYTEGARGEWYTVTGERVPYLPDPSDDVSEEARQLGVIRAGFSVHEAPRPELDDAGRAALWALGHGEGDRGNPAGTIDPRDGRGAMMLIDKGRAALKKGRPVAAMRILFHLEREVSGSPAAQRLEAEIKRAMTSKDASGAEP